MTVSIAIMAGGKSSRMGQNKSFVKLHDRPMIDYVLERVRKVPHAELFIVTNSPDSYAWLGLPMVRDVLPESGSLGGILTAVHHSSTEYTLVVATDMPFVSATLLRHLVQLANSGAYDVVVPRADGYPEGLCAVYSKACLNPIRQQVEEGRLKVVGFYRDVRVYYVDPEEYQVYDPHGLSFLNINTPEELEYARRIARGL